MGTGSEGPSFLVPTQVPSLLEGEQPFAGEKIRVVACGCFHILALTMDGQVWTWGRDFKGVLGIHIMNNNTLYVPRPIPSRALFYGRDAESIAAGFSHSAVVAGGIVFTFGAAVWGDTDNNGVWRNFYTGVHHTIPTLLPRAVHSSYLRDQKVGFHQIYKPALMAFVMGWHARLGTDSPPPAKPRRRESQRLKGKDPAQPDAKTQGCRVSKRLNGEEPDKYARGMTCIYNGWDTDILRMIFELTRPVVSKRYEGIMRLQGARVEERVATSS